MTPAAITLESESRRRSPFDDWPRWVLFALAWGLIVLGAYSRSGWWDEFCERTVPVAMLVLTMFATAGGGGRVLRLLRLESSRPLEFFCLSSAVGWAALSLPLCWLAATGLFEAGFWSPLALGVSLTLGFGFDGKLSGWDLFRRVPWSRSSVLYRHDSWTFAAAIVCGMLIGVTFIWAWGPVWDYDSEMYHLPNAVLLIEQHALVVDRDEPLSNLPGQAYLWYALGLSAGAEAYPALLVWWAAVLTSLLAASLANRWLGTRAALWTVPVFWSGMIVHAVASTPRVEPIYSLMFLASIALLFEAAQRKQLTWGTVACCGLCLGTAGAVKYQGFYGWPLIGCWWVWLWCRYRHWRSVETLFRVTVMFLIGFAVLSPWWIKNYRAFGNPIYPMFNRAQLDPDSLRNANPHGPHRPHPWYFLVVDTFELFAKPNTFSGPPHQYPHYLFLLLPLLLVVGRRGTSRAKSDGSVQQGVNEPLCATAPARFQNGSSGRDFVRTLIWLAGGYYVLSLTLTHELRHMFGMFSLAAILVAHVVSEFGLRWRLNILLPGLVVANVAFVLLFPGRLFRLPGLLNYTVGLASEQRVREQLVPAGFSRACEWCNANTSANAVILLCWEARTYRLHRKAITDPGWSTWKTLFRNRSTPEEVRAYLKREGVDYVLVNAGSLEFNVNQSRLIPEQHKADFLRQRELLVPAVLEPVYEIPKGATKAVCVYRVTGVATVLDRDLKATAKEIRHR